MFKTCSNYKLPHRHSQSSSNIHVFFAGSFVAFTDANILKVPSPNRPGELPITRHDRSSTASLISPAALYDNGQALQISILDEQYTVVVGLLSLEIFRNISTGSLLEHVDSWSYPDGHQPTKLLKSVTNPENFFLTFQEHRPLEFAIDNGEIHSMQSSIEEAAQTLSTVLPSADDDIYALVSGNQVRLFSVSEQEYKRTVSLAPNCMQITNLYSLSLPAIPQVKTVAFGVKCISSGGQVVQYHVIASYRTNAPLEFTAIELGFPIASSTFLAVRNESTLTVYNRMHLTSGVPQSHTFDQEIQKVVVFEAQTRTKFLAYTVLNSLTQIDASDFFYAVPGAIQSIPGTLQDSSNSPHMIIDDGLVVVARNNQKFDMVALTMDSTTFALIEAARGVGTSQSPSFVTFVPDPNSPSIVTEPTEDFSTQPTTIANTDEPTVDLKSWIIPLVLLVVVLGVVVLFVISVIMYKGRKSMEEDARVHEATDLEGGLSAPVPDKSYVHPIEESNNPVIILQTAVQQYQVDSATSTPFQPIKHDSLSVNDSCYNTDSARASPYPERGSPNNSQATSQSDVSMPRLDSSSLFGNSNSLHLSDTHI